VELRSRFLFHDGGKVIFGTCEDITERKVMERQLEDYSKELERSNRDLEDFAAIASHDLQEPLRKIMNFGDRLAAFFEEPNPDRARDYLGRIQRATQRMQEFIENLLEYSRITTRARPLELVELQRLIREVVTLFDIRLSNSGGEVSVGPMPNLMADEFQMRQLFQNLIGNAIKFRRPGVPPVVSVSAQELPGVYEITIEDNGVGFDEKHLDRIFKPFERLHARSEYEGSGMGLAICKKIVDRHGGTLSARSRPGEGTRFILSFPIKPSKVSLSRG
jgi:light-regulated signal transduction histidine kinase (bacteriophytochrome)